MLIFFKFLLFISFIYLSIKQIASQNVIVNTTRGSVVGYHFDQGNDTTQTWYGQADVFQGIPFALPPVGELRYKVNLKIFVERTSPLGKNAMKNLYIRKVHEKWSIFCFLWHVLNRCSF